MISKEKIRKFVVNHPSYLIVKTSYPDKVLRGKDFDEINPEFINWLNIITEQIGFMIKDFIEENKLTKEKENK